MEKNLKFYLEKAKAEKFSLPQFNFSDFTQLQAIAETCAALKAPAIIGTSEGESKFVGLEEAVAMRDALQKKYGAAVFLNLDHGKSVEYIGQAIAAGYDMVHYDGSKLPFAENITNTMQVAELAKAAGIPMEGEMGRIGTDASRVYEEAFEVNEAYLTKPEEALQYANETGVDLLAVSIGNFHGIAKQGEPRLRLDLLAEINRVLRGKTGITLHGGSGTTEQDIKSSIANGIVKININTESRMAFTGALRDFLQANPTEIVPYKFLAKPKEAMAQVVAEKLTLFGAVGRA